MTLEAGDRRVRAERELQRVHRRELARCLRDAARLRMLDGAGVRTYDLGLAPLADGLGWRSRAEALVAHLECDRVEFPDLGLLRACLARSRQRWPAARELALASLLAEDVPAGRLVLGLSQLADGEPSRAAETLSALVRDLQPGETGDGALAWRAWQGLGDAHEACGRDELGLRACLAAARIAGCGVGPLSTGLFLALALASPHESLALADRIDRACRPESPALVRASQRLRERIVRFRGPLPWQPPRGSRTTLRSLMAREGSSSRALVGALT